MPNINIEQVSELISNSQIAFINGQYQKAYGLAIDAIKLDSNCVDAYHCAANVCMSLGRYEDAIDYYQKAVNCDSTNGNRYFSLGYAQASVNKIAEAMQNFAKADELGLNEDAAGQMYHILGIVNQQFGKLDDALINLKKSEFIIPADMDILKRKAVIYGLLDEITNGLQTANQMKLLAPSDYSGYQAAYILLKQAGRIDDAFKELRYARMNLPTFPFALCGDMVNYELVKHEQDGDDVHFQKALVYIKHFLKKEKPSVSDVIECYLTAADLYLQLEDAEKVIECLNATEKPVFSYNNGVMFGEYSPQQLDPNSILNEMNANLYRYEQLSFEQLETMRKSGTYITPTEESTVDNGEYKLIDETFDISADDRDRINRMYIGAYTLLEDYRKIMYYALELQKSKEPSMVELGWYTEARAMRVLNLNGWQDQYASVIKKLRNNILKDPTDINAMMLRVRCLIDTKQFDEAEEKCKYLKEELQKPLMEELNEARNGGM